MANPGFILPYLARYFDVPPPNYVTGVKLPDNILALYDADTQTIYFRDEDPPIYVIAHEFGHHLHTVHGIKMSKAELERIANEYEKIISRFYNVEPPFYGYPTDPDAANILMIIGLILLGYGVFGL